MRSASVVVMCALAACGGGSADSGLVGSDGRSHDGGVSDVDAAPAPMCGAVTAIAATVPTDITYVLGAADLEAPAGCAVVDAPFGVMSAGVDRVIAVAGLTPGEPYMVELTSAADLSFYVITGCSTSTGPAPSECLLFEDATTGAVERHDFVATGDLAYVVVDDYAPTAPPDGSFELAVYHEDCTGAVDCSGDAPACVAGRCAACATSFDCTDPAHATCDPATATCVVGTGACSAYDAGEPTNDGPAGAAALASGVPAAGVICSDPASELDFWSFTAQAGDSWTIDVATAGSAPLLELTIYDATGTAYGASRWLAPAEVVLTYLPAGTYYAAISEPTARPDPTAIPYAITATRAGGDGCASAADCAATYDNQLFRGRCTAGGTCVAIAGGGVVSSGGRCDAPGDCAAGLGCPALTYAADAATRSQCEPTCTADAGCTALGAGYVCTTNRAVNSCVAGCTADDQCPANPAVAPPPGQPWARTRCDGTGHCT